jgi:hypothetical protein
MKKAGSDFYLGDNALFSRLSEQLSFFLTLCVLPGVLDNKRGLRVSLAMCLPASRCPAGYATRPYHQPVDDKPLRRTIPLNLNKPLAIFCDNCGIKPKLFLIKIKPCLRSCVGRRVALQFSGYKDLRPVVSIVFPSLRVADKTNVQLALCRGTLNRLVGLYQ